MIFPVLPEKRERVIPVDSQNKLLYNLKKTRELSENGRKEEVIHSILTEKTVDVKAEVQDWEEAVRAAGELLYDNGDVEACYIDNMINIVKEVGPYIVLLKGVALAHARPEQGAKKNRAVSAYAEDTGLFWEFGERPCFLGICAECG